MPCEGLSILPMDVYAVGGFLYLDKRDLYFGLDFYTRGIDFAKKISLTCVLFFLLVRRWGGMGWR